MPKSRFVQFFQRKNNSDHTIRKVIGRHTYRSHRCQPTLAATWNKEKPSSSILISTSFFSSKILWQISILFRNLGAEGTCLRENNLNDTVAPMKISQHFTVHRVQMVFQLSLARSNVSRNFVLVLATQVQEYRTDISVPNLPSSLTCVIIANVTFFARRLVIFFNFAVSTTNTNK